MSEKTVEGEEEPKGKPARPNVRVRSITFNDGQTLTLEKSEIVVFVGPNNSGKSLALRELYGSLERGSQFDLRVFEEVAWDFDEDLPSVRRWTNSLRVMTNGNLYVPGAGVHGKGAVPAHWENRRSHGIAALAPAFAVLLNTDARLSAAQQVPSIDLIANAPEFPLQVLYDDEELEAKLDHIYARAFGSHLLVNRFAGQSIYLHVGTPPIVGPGEDRLSKSYRERLGKLPLVQGQGDGIRAFVGILLNALVADRDALFIDEPEAFLHPPQAAMLGRILASETPADRQLFISTHSTDFLRGLLEEADTRVRVVRITRDGDTNRIAELSPRSVSEVWSDPLLRYSKVLDGLFHDGVVVCEGDADCRFYSAMIEAVNKGQPRPDLWFVYGAGKSRIAAIIRALGAIKVPIRVVADFDILNNEQPLRQVFEGLGGAWNAIQQDWNIVTKAVVQKRPQLNKSDAERAVQGLLAANKEDVLSDETLTKLRGVLRSASAWAEAKKTGRRFIPTGDATQAYIRLDAALKSVGLHVVGVGEVEGFCPSVGGHGPQWVIDVLGGHDAATAPELAEARDFARELATGWR